MRTFAVSGVLEPVLLSIFLMDLWECSSPWQCHGLLGYAPLAWTPEIPNKAKASHTLCVCLGFPFLLQHAALSKLMIVPFDGKEANDIAVELLVFWVSPMLPLCFFHLELTYSPCLLASAFPLAHPWLCFSPSNISICPVRMELVGECSVPSR